MDGQVASQSDGVGTYSYSYDSSSEHRRLPTRISVGGGPIGEFAMAYNAFGAPTTITYPNGLVRSRSYDEIGASIGLDYISADGTGLLSFSNNLDVDGRVLAAASAASQQDYTYDPLGRLAEVEDDRTDGCTTRTYGFASASERTSFKSYAPGINGVCQTTVAAVSRTHTYDPANRIRNAGYTYDDLGRTLTIPTEDTASGGAGPLSATYYVNDMVNTLRQTLDKGANGTFTLETAYGLDPLGRVNTVTKTIAGTESERLRYRSSDTSDAPTSIQVFADAGHTRATTRFLIVPGLGMIGSIDGGITTWQLANLHGDIVATQTNSAGIDTFAETDEYGNALGTPTINTRYGWLGAHQRSTDTAGGLVLMGARLYNPIPSIFLSPDAVQGGNATPYVYPADPVNNQDLTGLYSYSFTFPMTWAHGFHPQQSPRGSLETLARSSRFPPTVVPSNGVVCAIWRARGL